MIAEKVTLIGAANAAPVALKRLLSDRYSTPVDGGLILRDGRRLLGPPKTWRGIALAILVPADNIEKAATEIPERCVSILLSHTPEIYRQAAR